MKLRLRLLLVNRKTKTVNYHFYIFYKVGKSSRLKIINWGLIFTVTFKKNKNHIVLRRSFFGICIFYKKCSPQLDIISLRCIYRTVRETLKKKLKIPYKNAIHRYSKYITLIKIELRRTFPLLSIKCIFINYISFRFCGVKQIRNPHF